MVSACPSLYRELLEQKDAISKSTTLVVLNIQPNVLKPLFSERVMIFSTYFLLPEFSNSMVAHTFFGHLLAKLLSQKLP